MISEQRQRELKAEIDEKLSSGELDRESARAVYYKLNLPVPSDLTETSDVPTQRDTFMGSESLYGGGKAMFPESERATSQGQPASEIGSAFVGDVLSIPGGAYASIFPTKDEQEGKVPEKPYVERFRERQTDQGTAHNIITDPSNVLMATPQGAIARSGKIVKDLLGAGKYALKEGTMSGAIHQAQDYGQTGEVDPGKAIEEGVITSVFGGGISGASDIAKKSLGFISDITPQGVKNWISRRNPETKELLEEAVQPGRLNEIRQTQLENAGDVTPVANAVKDQATRIKDKAVLGGEQILGNPADMIASREGATATYEGVRKNIGQEWENKYQEILSDIEQRDAVSDKVKNIVRNRVGKLKYNEGADTFVYKGININPEVESIISNELSGISKNATGPQDILTRRRKIDNMLYDTEKFKKGTSERHALEEFRGDLNQMIEADIRSNLLGDELADLWVATNKEFSDAVNVLDVFIERKYLGQANNMDFTKIINRNGSKKLNELKALAESNPAVKPFYEDIKTAYKNELMARSMNNGGLDLTKFMKEWTRDTQGIKPIIFDADEIKTLDALAQLGKQEGSIDKLTGTDDDVLNIISNIGNRARREGLAQMKTLDILLGNKKGEGLTDVALDLYKARQLGMDTRGKLALNSSLQVNRGKDVEATMIGMGAGGTMGAVASKVSSSVSRSPLASYTIYKIADKFEKAGDYFLSDELRMLSGVLEAGLENERVLRGAVKSEQNERPQPIDISGIGTPGDYLGFNSLK